MNYQLILANDKIETACCAHCGLLRHRQLGEEVSHALCHDFLLHTTISAPTTWYVMDSSLPISCCQPQILTFERCDHAEKFVLGFGGNVHLIKEAINIVYEKMRGHAADCGKHRYMGMKEMNITTNIQSATSKPELPDTQNNIY